MGRYVVSVECWQSGFRVTYAVAVGYTGAADSGVVVGYGAVVEPAGQSVTYEPQLVTVTSVVTSTVDVPQLPP